MDKKNLPLLILVFAIIGVGGGYYYLNSKDKNDNNTNAQTQSPAATYPPITDACAKFTLEDAKQVIGESAKADSSVAPGVTGDEVNITTCTYSVGSSENTLQTASLLIRSPKTQAGAAGNQVPFNEGKLEGVIDVTGVGEKAYWDPSFGQLHVLVKDNWLIITAGPTKASDRTQDQAVQAANLIIPRI